MKRLMILLAFLTGIAGCTKEETLTSSPEEQISTKAIVDYMGDPAADGFGWVLRTGNTFEIPVNLKEDFKVDEMKVDVVFTRTEQVFPCHCLSQKKMVNIITISRSL